MTVGGPSPADVGSVDYRDMMRLVLDSNAPEVHSFALTNGCTLSLLSVVNSAEVHVEGARLYWAFERNPRSQRLRWVNKAGDYPDGVEVGLGVTDAGLRAVVREVACEKCGLSPWFPTGRSSVAEFERSGKRSNCLSCSHTAMNTLLMYLRIEGEEWRAVEHPINRAEYAALAHQPAPTPVPNSLSVPVPMPERGVDQGMEPVAPIQVEVTIEPAVYEIEVADSREFAGHRGHLRGTIPVPRDLVRRAESHAATVEAPGLAIEKHAVKFPVHVHYHESVGLPGYETTINRLAITRSPSGYAFLAAHPKGSRRGIHLGRWGHYPPFQPDDAEPTAAAGSVHAAFVAPAGEMVVVAVWHHLVVEGFGRPITYRSTHQSAVWAGCDCGHRFTALLPVVPGEDDVVRKIAEGSHDHHAAVMSALADHLELHGCPGGQVDDLRTRATGLRLLGALTRP